MATEVKDPFGLIGERLHDKVVIESLIGEGGFGVVYRATHGGFDAPVAVKCLKLPAHFDDAARAALVEQLRAEGRLLLKLSQRTAGIVQALDTGTHTTPSGAQVPFLVLEWVAGVTLAQDLKERRRAGRPGRSLREALALLAPAAEALAVAHGERVAHRDIKPENLMLSGESAARTLKVLDFGIAKLLSDLDAGASDARTGSGAPVFTPGYAAPEQFEKRRGASGPWSDVFSLALVFVEVVAGRRAIAPGELLDVFAATVDEGQRPTLAALGVNAPAAVARVLDRALSVDPRARYADAASFWRALEEAVQASPADAREEHDLSSLPTGAYLEQQGQPRVEGEDTSARAGARTALASAPTERATTRGPLELNTAASPAPRRRRVAVAAGLVVAAGAAALWVATRPPPAAPPPLTSVASAAPSASVAPSASAPVSSNAEASSRYQEALAQWRGGNPEAAIASLRKAVELDRALSAAHLRLALWLPARDKVAAREHYELAKLHADRLGEQDAQLLAAAEPLGAVPLDLVALEARLAELAARRPSDAHVAALLSTTRLKQLRYADALGAAEAALAVDDAHVAAWVFKGEALVGAGRRDELPATYQGCLQKVPRAVECLHKLVSLRSSLGQCTEMLQDAKRLVELDGNSHRSHRLLAVAIHATGGAREAVLEALKKSWSLAPAKDRASLEARERAYLALVDGDFKAALAQIELWSAAVASAPDQDAHLEPVIAALDVERELGALDALGRRATDAQRRMTAWTEPVTGDWSLVLARYRLFAAELTPAQLDLERTTWLAKVDGKWSASGRRSTSEHEWNKWVTAWGHVAIDADCARLALERMPEESAMFSSGRFASVDMVAGRVLALAGEVERAAPALERATRHCSVDLSDPVAATVSLLYLGDVRAQRGEPAGAREAYEKALARWGKEPSSRTAQLAKARLAALPKAPAAGAP